MKEWLETCRRVYNYSLRELKDWIALRKYPVDRCSLNQEYIVPADEPFPSYHRQQNNLPKAKKNNKFLSAVHSQVLQTTVRRLHDTWDVFQVRLHNTQRSCSRSDGQVMRIGICTCGYFGERKQPAKSVCRGEILDKRRGTSVLSAGMLSCEAGKPPLYSAN